MDLRGIEPLPYPCHGYVIPFYYRPAILPRRTDEVSEKYSTLRDKKKSRPEVSRNGAAKRREWN